MRRHSNCRSEDLVNPGDPGVGSAGTAGMSMQLCARAPSETNLGPGLVLTSRVIRTHTPRHNCRPFDAEDQPARGTSTGPVNKALSGSNNTGSWRAGPSAPHATGPILNLWGFNQSRAAVGQVSTRRGLRRIA
ncbi:hypothetical protein AAFF_G00078660 [Aldrovandia affinis]|uniref:Uncharacterized protein n=1 Tax=Aldrovandia affinis TaxID=143900 RepID=A0AAD7RXM2_9TELE|nr:hypothetical protein AAFF_G00078660 [Aldrovandia affinis]